MEEIHRLEFGYEDDVDWIDNSSDRSLKKATKKRKKKLNLSQLKVKYKVGQKISGTVIHHIEDNEKPDHVVGFLVSIVENW